MEKLQVYKCPVCGNIVEVLHVGGGTLVCCGKPMELQVEGTSDGALEKHVPVVEKNGKLNYSIIPQFHSYTVENIDSTSLHIDYKNGNVQKIIMNSNLNLLKYSKNFDL